MWEENLIDENKPDEDTSAVLSNDDIGDDLALDDADFDNDMDVETNNDDLE